MCDNYSYETIATERTIGQSTAPRSATRMPVESHALPTDRMSITRWSHGNTYTQQFLAKRRYYVPEIYWRWQDHDPVGNYGFGKLRPLL